MVEQQEMGMSLIGLLARDPSTLTVEEINFITGYAAQLRAVNKVAKDKGLIVAKVAKVDNPELTLLADALSVVIRANLDVVNGLFKATKTAEKPNGNLGINVTIGDCAYNVQLLSKAARLAEVAEAKAAKVAKAAKGPSPEQIAAAEAAKTATI